MIKLTAVSLLFSVMALVCSCYSSEQSSEKETEKRIRLIQNDAEQKVDVLIDGKLFTSYIYPNTIKKPVLYPVITPKGTKITRRFPMESSEGERVDHPHHVGLWFNYGDVNGLDFWNNSDSIALEKRDKYGTIVHKKINSIVEGDDEARLDVSMDWLAPDGTVLLNQNTVYVFRGEGDEYSIDHLSTLTAVNENVDFKDNKEGMIAIRVRRELEHPSDKPDIFTDANGLATGVPVLNNEGVNGHYINSEGIEGEDCWGTRANWVALNSSIGDEKVAVAILDNTENVGFPAYWHARGYGLFAANPLGQAAFSKGKETLDFKLVKGESVQFKYRVIIASKTLNKSEMDAQFEKFSVN